MKRITNKILKLSPFEALDRIDFEILEALQKNARLSNKELAAKVKLAPSSCLQRVRRLDKADVLKGYHAELEPKALGIGLQSIVAVRLKRHSRNLFRTLHAHLLSLPEVLSIYHVAGANDLLVDVAVRDSNHLRDMIVDEFAIRPEVDRTETALIFSYSKKPLLPNYRPKE